MPTAPPIVAIVPAAGAGVRALEGSDNTPKQYRQIKGQALLRWTVYALLADARVQQVRVAVAPQDTQATATLAGLPRTVCRPCGGATRAHTVWAALRDATLPDNAWVLVHDAARPGLPPATLARLLDTCLTHGQGGLLALPVANTVKQAHTTQTDRVAATVPRNGLWLAQTPQCFPAGLLLRALQAAMDAGVSVSDEAAAVEMLGEMPLLVPGSPRNHKVTWPEDFAWIETWLT